MTASLQAEYIEQLKQQSETERLDQITDDLRQSITSIGSLAALLDIQAQDVLSPNRLFHNRIVFYESIDT